MTDQNEATPSSRWAEANPSAPCPVCGGAEGCRVLHDTAACRNRDGPLARPFVGPKSDNSFYLHPRDPATGRLFEPVPVSTRRFLAVVFEPTDVVLVRPVEGWTEDGKKRSRVVYRAVRYPTAKELADDYQAWATCLDRLRDEHANAYFGVCPRHGTRHFDLAWQIRSVRVLWADIDHCSVEEATRRCEAAGLPTPTATVSSGHGVHLYWRLDEPVRIDAPPPVAVLKEFVKDEAGKTKPRSYWVEPGTRKKNYELPATLSPDAVRVQRVLGGIAAAVGGDHTQDLSRLLRLPGTLNRKNERNGTPPVPCELVACDDTRRYPFAAFEVFADWKPDAPPQVSVRLPSGGKLTAARRNRLGALLNVSAVAAVGIRSEADFAVCAYAVETGLDADAVWAEAKDTGKFAAEGRDYFERTWKKAEEKVRGTAYAKACRAAGIGGAGARTPPVGDEAPAVNEAPDDPHLLARSLRTSNADPRGDTWRFFRDEVWEWTGRRWKPVPDGEIRCRVAEFCKRTLDESYLQQPPSGGDEPTVPKVSRELVSNVLQAIGGMTLVPRDVPQPCWFADGGPEPRPLIALENGLLDVEALLAGVPNVLVPHTPQWFSPICLPYPFDPDADCPTWRGVLGRNLGDDPGKARLLQQWAGYLLLPDTRHQRFLMMTGEGANGKSVVCAVLRALLGEDNVSAVGLELFGDKFHLAETLGKLANVVPEVGELDRIAEGQLKAFVAGDSMLFERKYKQPFSARPTARLVLATNNPPHFSDKSDGVWRRVDLLRFVVQIPVGERVAGMDKVEFWERTGDLPGILNWALAGLADLRREGRFVIPSGCADDLRGLRLESNPTRRFLVERYQCGTEQVATAVAYRAYAEWCGETGHRAASDTTFGKEVARAFPGVERKRCGPRVARFWAYVGLEPRLEPETDAVS